MPATMLNALQDLPASERARLYRELADEAVRHADGAPQSVQQAYLIMAEQWRRLAHDAEGMRDD